MAVVELERADDGVAVLRMTAGENRINPTWLGEVEDVLSVCEADDGPTALVTVGEGKFWSNGLDLDWLGQQPPEQWGPFTDRLHAVLGRLLVLGIPTVAACNGHVFAAGAMLSLAHDERVLRSDRGYWCLPEADIDIPFLQPMNDLIVAKLPQPVRHDAMVTGRRYGADDAVAAGIGTVAAPEAEVLPVALERARALAGKDRGTVATIKERLYAATLISLTTPAAG